MGAVRKYTLCLIDLQAEFEAAYLKRVQHTVVQEITRAKRLGRDIMTVLYTGSGPLLKRFKIHLNGYDKAYSILKTDDDGGDAIMGALTAGGPQHLRVCGVNTDACVMYSVSSASDLFEQYPGFRNKKIQVVADGCWTEDGDSSHDYGLNEMNQLPNVEIV